MLFTLHYLNKAKTTKAFEIKIFIPLLICGRRREYWTFRMITYKAVEWAPFYDLKHWFRIYFCLYWQCHIVYISSEIRGSQLSLSPFRPSEWDVCNTTGIEKTKKCQQLTVSEIGHPSQNRQHNRISILFWKPKSLSRRSN